MNADIRDRLREVLARAARRLGDDRSDAWRRLAARTGIAGLVAAETDAAMRRFRKLHERLLLDAAGEASEALARVGVPHMFFKGIALVGREYISGERDLSDVDVLVAPARRAAALAVFRELGYRDAGEDFGRGPLALEPSWAVERPRRTGVEGVKMDVHWGYAPVHHLLPRAGRVPEGMWTRVEPGPVPRPAAADHAALILHHLVRHDLLHVKGVVDLLVLWPQLMDAGGARLPQVARALGVRRVLGALADMFAREFGLPRPDGLGPDAPDLRAPARRRLVALDRCFARAARASDREEVMITPVRIVRRAILVDRMVGTFGLAADVTFPPRAYLRWRWPNAGSYAGAWLRHAGRVVGKAAGR